jgi:hypothetical protein
VAMKLRKSICQKRLKRGLMSLMTLTSAGRAQGLSVSHCKTAEERYRKINTHTGSCRSTMHTPNSSQINA